MTCGETRENPVFDWMNLIRAKKHYCNASVLQNFASFVDLIFGVLLYKVFFILKQYTVTCQTKYFMDKMNYVSRCEPVYSKKSDILPNND